MASGSLPAPRPISGCTGRSTASAPARAPTAVSARSTRTAATNYPQGDAGWSGETALDLDAVSAICPNCHILLVEANDGSDTNLALAANEAAVLGATQISNSYSEGEWGADPLIDQDYTHPGVAVTASSGDAGWAGGTGYPATSPDVTAVGGTSLTFTPSTARGWTETAWSGSGSGCSVYESKPAWQTDAGCADRTVADVSADGDPASGAAVYSTPDSGWEVLGGTSLASPLVAAYDALIMSTQGAAAASPEYPYTHLSSYYDITLGSTGSCAASYLCTAGTGYDGPTGVGSPHGAGLRPPAVVTGNASAIGSSSATLNGQVNPRGPDSHYDFQYGTTATYGSSTSSVDAGSGMSVLSESAPVSSLAANTTYHFRIVATNTYGTSDGSDNTFTTGAPPPSPANTVKPHVVGSPLVGDTLTVLTGTWTGSPDSFGYEWYDCLPVGGGGCHPNEVGTSSTYVLASSDLGGQVYAFVRAHNASGWSSFTESDNVLGPIVAPVPSNTTAPQISGSGSVGATLSVSTGSWSGSPTAFAYQWWRCVFGSGTGCMPSSISGDNSSTYTITSSELNSDVWATVQAQNAYGFSAFVNSDNTIDVPALAPPANTVSPHVSGDPVVGATLTVSTGAWTASPDAYGYQWYDCLPSSGGGCTPTQVGNGSSYLVAGSDLNGYLYAYVRAHNGAGWSGFAQSDNTLGAITAASGANPSGANPSGANPSGASPSGSGQPPTRSQTPTVPASSITRLAVSPNGFRAALRGARSGKNTGAWISFKLSSSAYVIFTFERALPGREVKGRCVAPAPRMRGRSCTRSVAVAGELRYPGSGLAAAGSVSFRFGGRVAGKVLVPGAYRLNAVAINSTGATSKIARSNFRITS